MSETIKEDTKNCSINISIKNGDKITFVNGNTGVETLYVVNGSSISLSKGFIYTLPIEDINIDLENYYIIKEIPSFACKCMIRGVSDGKVTIYPIVNGVVISDGDLLGKLI